jgi:hypothetical protein
MHFILNSEHILFIVAFFPIFNMCGGSDNLAFPIRTSYVFGVRAILVG